MKPRNSANARNGVVNEILSQIDSLSQQRLSELQLRTVEGIQALVRAVKHNTAMPKGVTSDADIDTALDRGLQEILGLPDNVRETLREHADADMTSCIENYLVSADDGLATLDKTIAEIEASALPQDRRAYYVGQLRSLDAKFKQLIDQATNNADTVVALVWIEEITDLEPSYHDICDQFDAEVKAIEK